MILIKRVIEFCAWSGQRINFEKSKLFCSHNTLPHIAKEMANICGSRIIDDLGMYLGVPLIHDKTTHHTYEHVVEKARTELAN